MDNKTLARQRYRHENDQIIIDVAVKNSRQLFNERDPAPFRERDRDETDQLVEQTIVREAIQAYFIYESKLTRSKLRERLKIGRWFFVIGLISLFICLSISQFFGSLESSSKIWSIAREGFVIVGWVAMWRPVEVFLYDWWPLREQRLFLEKVAGMSVQVRCGESK